ncbi:MAG: hypothetical protein JW934_16380 [Anaerolineae bacterium]|nr:hypothetical protein [Anaerolineae bacterium]
MNLFKTLFGLSGPTSAEHPPAQAGQSVVNAFTYAVDAIWPPPEAGEMIRQAIAPIAAQTPELWASQAAHALVALVNRLQSDLVCTRTEMQQVRQECGNLRILTNQATELQKQIGHLRGSCDYWQDKAGHLQSRIESLEGQLDQVERENQHQCAEVARLYEQIAQLNRIVVEQQDALNEQAHK